MEENKNTSDVLCMRQSYEELNILIEMILERRHDETRRDDLSGTRCQHVRCTHCKANQVKGGTMRLGGTIYLDPVADLLCALTEKMSKPAK